MEEKLFLYFAIHQEYVAIKPHILNFRVVL